MHMDQTAAAAAAAGAAGAPNDRGRPARAFSVAAAGSDTVDGAGGGDTIHVSGGGD